MSFGRSLISRAGMKSRAESADHIQALENAFLHCETFHTLEKRDHFIDIDFSVEAFRPIQRPWRSGLGRHLDSYRDWRCLERFTFHSSQPEINLLSHGGRHRRMGAKCAQNVQRLHAQNVRNYDRASGRLKARCCCDIRTQSITASMAGKRGRPEEDTDAVEPCCRMGGVSAEERRQGQAGTKIILVLFFSRPFLNQSKNQPKPKVDHQLRQIKEVLASIRSDGCTPFSSPTTSIPGA